MNDDTDVLILGGGAIGLCCAHYLLQAGRSVRVLERDAVGSGSSHGNCGTLTPSHAAPLAEPGMIRQALAWMGRPDAPFYVRPRFDPALFAWLLRFAGRCTQASWAQTLPRKAQMLQVSRVLIERLIHDAGLDCEFSASGLLYVFREAVGLEHVARTLPALAACGIDAEIWDANRLRCEEPAVRDDLHAAVFFPGDARLRPDRYVSELARVVRAAGGVIDEHCAVIGFTRGGGRIEAVHSERGPLRAREVVFALGAWSPQLGRQLGLRLPIQPGKGYSITYSRPTLTPIRPLVLKERSICVTTWGDGFRLGSTMEFSGYDNRLNRRRLDALVHGAREYLRVPEGQTRIEEWYGWRPMTVDDLPLIGRAPGFDNLLLATGHGMMGIGMSALSGHLVADLLCARTPIFDPSICAPERLL